ncbi:MAG: mannose-1-phosphate guanylyltransferase, partial [bacterium]
TAPVLLWAAWTLSKKDPEAILVSLHSDHVVNPPDAFVSTVMWAARMARDHRRLMTVAVRPDRPEVGYGYIQPGDEIGEGFEVAAFHEKPDPETATRYVEGGYLWNSGIFVWPARTFLDEVRARAPEIGRLMVHLEEGRPERFFDEAPKISVDEAVLERSGRVAAVEAGFRWDDVGSWEALARNRSPGPEGNVVKGKAHFVESRNNIVYSEDKPVVLFGVDDLVVVRTGEVTLVTRRDRAPRLKELLDELPDELRNP